VRGTYLRQLGEDVEFELGYLGDCLDDKVDLGEGVEGGGGREEGAGGVGLVLRQARFGDVLGEKFV
jgi:hypothetical protein